MIVVFYVVVGVGSVGMVVVMFCYVSINRIKFSMGGKLCIMVVIN